MSLIHIPDAYKDDVKALQKAARESHPKGGMQTCSFCTCGNGYGGPSGTALCRALRYLYDLAAEVDRAQRCRWCRGSDADQKDQYGWIHKACAERAGIIETEEEKKEGGA